MTANKTRSARQVTISSGALIRSDALAHGRRSRDRVISRGAGALGTGWIRVLPTIRPTREVSLDRVNC